MLQGSVESLTGERDALATQLQQQTAAATSQTTELSDQLLELKSQLETTTTQRDTLQAEVNQLKGDSAGAGDALQKQVDIAKELESKLAEAEASNSQLSAKLAEVMKLNEDNQLGAAEAQANLVSSLKDDHAAEVAKLEKEKVSLDSKARLAEQELKSSRALVLEEQQKAERAAKVVDSVHSDLPYTSLTSPLHLPYISRP